MHLYQEKKFNIPELKGLSAKQIEVHLGLYAGYVKHVNVIREKLAELRQDPEKNAYLMAELRRSFGFEFDGMRMHEYYFEQFESGPKAPDEYSPALGQAVSEKYGDTEQFIAHIKEVATTRGIGWVIVYYDPVIHEIHTVFVADHELGQLAGLPIILAVDMWEHAFMVDYTPAEKGKYIDAFLQNLNWGIAEKRLSSI